MLLSLKSTLPFASWTISTDKNGAFTWYYNIGTAKHQMAFNVIESHASHWFLIWLVYLRWKYGLAQNWIYNYDCWFALYKIPTKIRNPFSSDCPFIKFKFRNTQSLKRKAIPNIHTEMVITKIECGKCTGVLSVTLPHFSNTSFLHLICKLIISILNISKVFWSQCKQQSNNALCLAFVSTHRFSEKKHTHFYHWKNTSK